MFVGVTRATVWAHMSISGAADPPAVQRLERLAGSGILTGQRGGAERPAAKREPAPSRRGDLTDWF